jgi:hypothetical protein
MYAVLWANAEVDPIGGEWDYESDGLGTGAPTGVGGRTPLQEAAQYGNVEAISVLMEFGTDLYLRDETMKTALHIAVEAKRANVVRMLVDYWPEGTMEKNGDKVTHLSLPVELLYMVGENLWQSQRSSHSKSPGRVRNGDAALASATGKPTTRLNPLPHHKFSRDRLTHLHATATRFLTVLTVTLLFPIEILSPCRSLFSHSPSSSSSRSAKTSETLTIDRATSTVTTLTETSTRFSRSTASSTRFSTPLTPVNFP